MIRRVAVLGPGGVGGALAVHLARSGLDVVCVAGPETAAAIRRDGLALDRRGETLAARPRAVDRLTEPVDLVLVAVKAPALDDALARIEPEAVADAAVVPLLNGLEHVGRIRARLGNRVAAGSIGRLEAYRAAPTRIVQTTAAPVVSLASADLAPERLRELAGALERAGIEVRLLDSEPAVLWEKAARLAPLAALTALTGRSIGEVRSDPELRPLLRQAIAEAAAAAAADGVPVDADEQLALVDGIAPETTTSTARDVAAGRPSELDAIAGAVVRAGRRLGVPTPTLDGILERCRAS